MQLYRLEGWYLERTVARPWFDFKEAAVDTRQFEAISA